MTRLPLGDLPHVDFTAARYRQREDWWFGRDVDGHPALLVADAADSAPDIETADLIVMRSRMCAISGPDRIEGRYTVLLCRSVSTALHRYFEDLCGDLEEWSREDPTRSIAELVRELVRFFSLLQSPARKTEQGLWGELLLIASTGTPHQLLNSWHVRESDRYDFSAAEQRVEVKTCTAERRSHRFSLSQLPQPPPDVCVLSLVVEPSAGGTRVSDLVDEISSKPTLTAEHVLALRRGVAETLGAEWLRTSREGFDRALALKTARFLRASAVPSVPLPVPEQVSDVHFASDVSNAPFMSRAEMVHAGGLWAVAAGLLQA